MDLDRLKRQLLIWYELVLNSIRPKSKLPFEKLYDIHLDLNMSEHDLFFLAYKEYNLGYNQHPDIDFNHYLFTREVPYYVQMFIDKNWKGEGDWSKP